MNKPPELRSEMISCRVTPSAKRTLDAIRELLSDQTGKPSEADAVTLAVTYYHSYLLKLEKDRDRKR